MHRIELDHNCLRITISIPDIETLDPRIMNLVKVLDKKFVLKTMIDRKTHKFLKHQNYKTKLQNDESGANSIRVIKLPKYEGINALKSLSFSLSEIVDRRTTVSTTTPVTTPVTPYPNTIKLYDHQTIVCDYIESKLRTRKTNSFVYIAKPGTGKTVVGTELISRFGLRTLIIVPNTFLVEQWKTEMHKFLSIPEDDPDQIIVWNSKNKFNLGFRDDAQRAANKIIISTIQSAIKSSNNHLVQDIGIGFTIFDEIHLYCSPKFSHIFWKAQTMFNLGLTGTEKRIDHFEKIYIQHLNALKTMEAILEESDIAHSHQAKGFTCVVKTIKNKTRYENIIQEKTGMVNYCAMLEKLFTDPERNRLIVDEVIEMYDENPNNFVYVFSDRIKHLQGLAEVVNSIRGDIKVLIGGAEKECIDYCVNEARVVFTTYQYSSVGVNIVKMNRLVFATPRKNNMNQIIGRILRNNTSAQDLNDKVRIVADIVDTNSIFYPQFLERKKFYMAEKYKIV
jgi:superfamily II DNA or RNA helicase